MMAFLGLRLARLVLTLFLVSGFVFSLQLLVPSGPADLLPNLDRPPTADDLRQHFALDPPVRFVDWIGRVLRGELGQSLMTGQPVAVLLANTAAASLQLLLMAIVMALAIGAALAGAARTGNRTWGRIADGLAVAGLAVPNFLIGLLLLWLVSKVTGLSLVGDRPSPTQHRPQDVAALAMPAFALAFALVPVLMRRIRDRLQAGAIGTAGWSSAIVAGAGQSVPDVIAVVSGLVIIETVFGIPGLGQLMNAATFGRDYPILVPIALIAATVGAVLIFVADVACALVDRQRRAVTAAVGEGASPPVDSSDRWRQQTRNRAAIVGLALIAVFVLLAVVAPWVSGDPVAISLQHRLQPPSAAHWFGTDLLGRDVLARLLDGIRPALIAGLVPPAAALVLGVPLGLCAGWLVRFGGVVGRVFDVLISSMTDALLAFPLLVMALVLASFARGGLITAIVALAIGATAVTARVVRSHVIAGVGGDRRPSIAAVLLVQTMLSVATAIIGFAAISALGYGEPPPVPSWGDMIGVKAAMLALGPWVAASAGLAVVLMALAFSLIGMGLRRRIALRPAVVRQAV